MPKKPIEWSKCIIYKICKDDDFYVGSTTDFTSRKNSHKRNCNTITCKEYNFKIYQCIREKGGWFAWCMTPLEEYKDCKSQIEARIREEEWRVKLNAQLNMRRAFIDEEGMKLRNKQYREEHKEELKKKQLQWCQKHKEGIKEKKSQYREEHKERFKEYEAQYHIDNKEKIHKYKNQKFECECGGRYTQSNKECHKKSKKHQIYLSI
jgi:hypothetical protein